MPKYPFCNNVSSFHGGSAHVVAQLMPAIVHILLWCWGCTSGCLGRGRHAVALVNAMHITLACSFQCCLYKPHFQALLMVAAPHRVNPPAKLAVACLTQHSRVSCWDANLIQQTSLTTVHALLFGEKCEGRVDMCTWCESPRCKWPCSSKSQRELIAQMKAQ